MTTTSLRCFYRNDVNNGSVSTAYEWALKPGTKDRYQVPGYWFDGSRNIYNIFYTDVAQSTLASVCTETLSGKAGPYYFYAADEAASLNYTIWTNDPAEQGKDVNKLISFGDSLSDTGKLFNGSDWKVPNPTSWYLGRFSNGPVWVELLAEHLHLPVYNWAVGGSWVGGGGPGFLPTLAEQVKVWKGRMALAQNYKVENTQFLIWMGANDVTGGSSAPSIIADMERGLTSLLDAGATRIMILNLPDISQAPAYRGTPDAPRIAKAVQEYNGLLVQVVGRLHLKYGAGRQIIIFDANSMFSDLLSHPGRFGMINAVGPCLDIREHSTINYALHFDVRKVCATGDYMSKWVFWDLVHPTTVVHGIIQSQVFQKLWKLWHPPGAAASASAPVGK